MLRVLPSQGSGSHVKHAAQRTCRGEVTVNFTTQSAMLIELRNAEGTIYSKKAKNIKYSLESGVPNSNPCYINCDEDSCVNELYIKCDKEICLNTVKF